MNLLPFEGATCESRSFLFSYLNRIFQIGILLVQIQTGRYFHSE